MKRERRGFDTQYPSYIQIIASNVLLYCGESKDHDSTSPTSKVILWIDITVHFL